MLSMTTLAQNGTYSLPRALVCMMHTLWMTNNEWGACHKWLDTISHKVMKRHSLARCSRSSRDNKVPDTLITRHEHQPEQAGNGVRTRDQLSRNQLPHNQPLQYQLFMKSTTIRSKSTLTKSTQLL